MRLDVRIPMLLWLHFTTFKTRREICPSTKHLAVASHHDAFHAVVNIEQGEGMLQFGRHGICERIVRVWAVEGKENDGRRCR